MNWCKLEQHLQRGLMQGELNACQIADFTNIGCRLACQLANASNRLLQEWVLRRSLFLLAQLTATLPNGICRQQAADQLYLPLLALQRLYRAEPDAYRKICQLRASLNQQLYTANK
ncbi:MAG: hypothetical protein JJU30_09305 [Alkalimonas sp.]|nr:hypothetical protein [Alkalimonas sp.]